MPMSNRKSPETDLQIACVEWYRWQYPKHLIWSVPNEGARKNKTLQRMGVVAGMPDLHLAWPREAWQDNGAFGVIELKAPGKRPTKAQEALLKWFADADIRADWCSTFEQFQLIVKDWHG